LLGAWLTIFVIVLTDAAGDICVTRGMKQVGAIHKVRLREVLRLVRRACRTPVLGLGIFCSACSFFLFLWILSWTDLSFAVPATALIYVFSTLGARFILHEKVTRARWAGSLLICLGVALTSLG
jgi:bacterial/archaeal transporter family protein